VVVYNRQDCCRDRLTQYSMDFIDCGRVVDRPSYAFSIPQARYSILL
jgi:hypothetical protein